MDFRKLFWFVVWYNNIVYNCDDVIKYVKLFYIGVSYEYEN